MLLRINLKHPVEKKEWQKVSVCKYPIFFARTETKSSGFYFTLENGTKKIMSTLVNYVEYSNDTKHSLLAPKLLVSYLLIKDSMRIHIIM